jgi:hypothetical protein
MNLFLARLDNIATAPISGTSSSGNVQWPSITPQTALLSKIARDVLYPDVTDRFHNFIISINLLSVVEASELREEIAKTDSVITYTSTQLAGQFTGRPISDSDSLHKTMSLIKNVNASFLPSDLSDFWNRTPYLLDRVAILAVYFGRDKWA